MKGKIPINAAKEISEKYGISEIVIFGYEPETGYQHITTYRKTKEMCKDAAKASKYLQKALHWEKE